MNKMKTLTINGVSYTIAPVVPAKSVTLLASAWKGDGERHSQVVDIIGVTECTKVDLQPTAEQLEEFHYKVLGFVAENKGGVVTVFAIGDKPKGDHTIQVTLSEVDKADVIRGNTVGTTMPRPDWAQTDPSKADFIKNKELAVDTPRNASGKNITVNNSGDYPIQGLKLYGKTTQFTTTGKNMFDGVFRYKYSIGGSGQNRPVTATTHPCSAIIPVEPNKTYTISGDFSVVADNTVRYGLFEDMPEVGSVTVMYGYGDTTPTVTVPANCHYLLLWFMETTYTEATVQVELGSTATAYEPYTGGMPSPNPDYPQELESVGMSKNLFNKDDFTYIKAYVDGNGLITGYSAGSRTVLYIPCAPNTTYTASRTAVATSERFGLGWTEEIPETGMTISTNTNMQVSATIGNKITHTITTGATAKYLVCYLGWTHRNQEAETLQIEIGNTATPYKPYDSGNIGVTVCGKNLFDLSSATADTIDASGNVTSSSNALLTDYIAVSSQYVTASGTLLDGKTNSSAYRVVGYDANKNFIGRIILSGQSATFDVSGYAYIRFCTFNTEFDINTIQLEFGNTSTEYEPYKDQTLTAQTPKYGLLSIGDVRDEIDFASGFHVQNCKQYNLLNYVDKCQQMDNTTYSSNILRFDFSNALGIKAGSTVLCNRFVNNFIHEGNLNIVRNKEGVSSHSANDILTVLIDKSRLATPDLAGFTTYLQNNEMLVVCQLKKHNETPLTAEELARYSALHTNKPNTTVFNDSGAEMEITYCTPNTAVPMNMGSGNAGKVLSVDEHGCVIPIPNPSVESEEHSGCYYRMVGGEKEWINPPMLMGVEYRTTERWNGKPVYTKVVEFGTLPNNETKTVAWTPDSGTCDYVVGYSGTTSGYGALPNHFANIFLSVNRASVFIETSDDRSSGSAVVAIKYTKV